MSAVGAVAPEWERAHPCPRRRWPRSRTTSTTSARWPASTTWASAATTTASARIPAGLSDVSRYPALFAELLARGWTETDCAALAGGNLLRVLRDAGPVRGQRGYSNAG